MTRTLGTSRRLLSICLGLTLLSLAGCQTPPEIRAADVQPSWDLPLSKAVGNAVRYEILPQKSDIRFLVFRAGTLAKLGHNHVIQAKNVGGEILLAPEIHRSRFFIDIPVKDIQVDDESARADEGNEFFPQPDEKAIAGTTRNMLGEQVLDAANYPTIEIRSVALAGPDWGLDVTARIKMHGIERDILVPTAIEYQRDTLVVTATFTIKQSDFGIVPMRVFGGALQVDDPVKVRMRIVASRRESSPPSLSESN